MEKSLETFYLDDLKWLNYRMRLFFMDDSVLLCSRQLGSATFPGTFSATVRLRELGLEGANEKCYIFLPAVEFDDKTIGLEIGDV